MNAYRWSARRGYRRSSVAVHGVGHRIPTRGTAEVFASERSFRPDVEGLRAVAILLVLCYHANLLWVSGGFVGVDVFFVISGFLITRLLFESQRRNGRVQLAEFYIRRMKRLLPAAALVTLSVLVAARLWSTSLEAEDTAKDAVYSAL